MTEWRDVGQVLLGSWPSQVASWGREAIAAYCAELKARGLSPDQAVIALRSVEGDFPPSASKLAAQARVDPSLPTFDEAWVLIDRVLGRTSMPDGAFENEGEARKAHDEAILKALDAHHPMIRSFVERQGLARLRTIQTGDPQWGEKLMADLRAAWGRHVEAIDRRQVAALTSGGREGLRQLDPLAAIGMGERKQLGAGDEQRAA